MADRIKNFKDGIFELHTRRFGKVAEIMIKKLFNLNKSTTNAYDLRDGSNGDRIEVKFSRVLKTNQSTITERNVIEECNNASLDVRMVESTNLDGVDFDSNIQQIKRTEFEVLYYGLFFYDRIAIFKLRTADILSTVGYSDFQHRGNEGEGQFHINPTTWNYHINNNLVCWLTYEELYDLFDN